MSRATKHIRQVLPIIGCLGGGSLYGWSGYSSSVVAQFGVGPASTAMVFSVALVSFTIGVLFSSALTGRLPVRLRLPFIALAASFFLLAAGASAGFVEFLLFYGVGFGCAAGVLYNFAISEASYSDYPTLLIPSSVAAFGLGGAVFGPWAASLANEGLGLWATFPALICLLAVVAVSFILPQNSSVTVTTHALFAKPDRAMARLWFIFASGSVTGLVVLGLAAEILTCATDGASLLVVAVFLVAIGNTFGRLAATPCSNCFGPAHAIAGALMLSLVCSFFLVFAVPGPILLGLLFLVAFAYGHVAANMPLLVRLQVAEDRFPSAFGLVFTGWGFAGLLGPWSAGVLFERTGQFTTVLLSCCALTLVCLYSVWHYLDGDGHPTSTLNK